MMTKKRPLLDENSEEVACKHPRQLESNNQLVSVASLRDEARVLGEETSSKCEDFEQSAFDLVRESSHGTNKNSEASEAGPFPHFLWINNAIHEADDLSFFPKFSEYEYQLRALFNPNEVFSPLDYPFRKPVSVGTEHQALVPDWEEFGDGTYVNLVSNSDLQVALAKPSSSQLKSGDLSEEKLMGTCVIPFPQSEASEVYCNDVAERDCMCTDTGSIRCVRQHIMEARQTIKENLGEDIFEKLGFTDMGEEVAKKWSEEEEEAFHRIVLSNPASLGMNFWEHLSAAFPSRTKQDIFSYYFNVFMLRKRAEQNRYDPRNIDSDNDEWQRTEAGMEDNEDSVVESLTGQDVGFNYQEEQVFDYNEDIEDDYETGGSKDGVKHHAVHRVTTDDEYDGDVDDIPGAISTYCVVDDCLKYSGEIPCKSVEESDVQDDSCTSYECQKDNVDCCGPCGMGANAKHSSDE